MQPIGRPSPMAFLAIGAALAALCLPFAGAAAFAVGIASAEADATRWGGFVAVGLAVAGIVAELLAIVAAIVELVAAGNGATRRSRFPAALALGLAGLAPLTCAIEWMLLVAMVGDQSAFQL